MNSSNTVETRSLDAPLIRWGAIWAGSVAAVGLSALLYALGLSFGFSSVNVEVPGRLRSLGIFAGTWGALTPLLALFVGGWVASRGAATRDKSAAFVQGLTTWGVTALGLIWLLSNVLGGAIGTAVDVTQGIVQTGGEALSAVGITGKNVTQNFLGKLNLDMDKALVPVNLKLKQAGKPTLSSQQLRKATEDVVRQAAVRGNIDRDVLVKSIVSNTSITAEDAQAAARAVEEQFQEAQARFKTAYEQGQDKLSALTDKGMQKLEETAQDTSAAIARVFWGLFAALGLGLVAAMAGSTVAAATYRPAA